MDERKAVLLLMFDLPAKTSEDHREYYHFMKNLRCSGFLQMQESCYLKLIRNVSSVEAELKSLNGIMPTKGNVSILPLSVAQFRGMRFLLGEPLNMELFTEDIVFIGTPEDENSGTNVSLDSATSEDADDNDAGDAHEHGEETA